MSVFNVPEIDNLSGITPQDMKKVRDSIFMLNEQLRYMFGNLTPEDNYSQEELRKYIERDNKIAEMKFDIDGLEVDLLNLDEYTHTQFQVVDGQIKMKVSKGEVSAEISLEPGTVTLKGNRVIIESDNLKVTRNGKLTAVDGEFSGDITASTFTSKDGRFWTTEDETYFGGFYAYESENSGVPYIASHMQDVGMGAYGSYCFWCGDDSDDPPFHVEYDGYVYANDIFLRDTGWNANWTVANCLIDIYDRLDALEGKI